MTALAQRRPGKGSRLIFLPTTPVPGHNFNTILCQANSILNVGDQTRIYHGRWRNADGRDANDSLKHYYAEVALATLPRDRWGALGLNPGATEGTVCSAVVELPTTGGAIVLNVDAARAMRVETADDEHFQPLAGFSGPHSCTLDTDGGLDGPVKWAKAALASLGGNRLRLRIHLKQQGPNPPRLFAVYVRA